MISVWRTGYLDTLLGGRIVLSLSSSARVPCIEELPQHDTGYCECFRKETTSAANDVLLPLTKMMRQPQLFNSDTETVKLVIPA